jgi:hypothetical protein
MARKISNFNNNLVAIAFKGVAQHCAGNGHHNRIEKCIDLLCPFRSWVSLQGGVWKICLLWSWSWLFRESACKRCGDYVNPCCCLLMSPFCPWIFSFRGIDEEKTDDKKRLCENGGGGSEQTTRLGYMDMMVYAWCVCTDCCWVEVCGKWELRG